MQPLSHTALALLAGSSALVNGQTLITQIADGQIQAPVATTSVYVTPLNSSLPAPYAVLNTTTASVVLSPSTLDVTTSLLTTATSTLGFSPIVGATAIVTSATVPYTTTNVVLAESTLTSSEYLESATAAVSPLTTNDGPSLNIPAGFATAMTVMGIMAGIFTLG